MTILNESLIFKKFQLDGINEHYNSVYVCDTEHRGIPVGVFYGEKEHPVSKSRYFALYFTPEEGHLMITSGAFIEDQLIVGAVADNGDIIFSRHRHDYRVSPDKSVMIDGGRAYTRTDTKNLIDLRVRNGVLGIDRLV